jgi:cell division protein FtsB
MATTRRPFQGRRAAAVVLGLFVAAGLIVIFAGTLARSTDIEAQAARARAEIEVLEARVAAGEAELELYRSEAFREWQARVYGFGRKDEEKLFMLPDDAPSPAPIVALGSRADRMTAVAPFDAWMELLFGD